MYTKLEIANFRAFKSLKADGLQRINLIAGDNNIGKTGLLEAIYLAHADKWDTLQKLPALFRRIQVREGENPNTQDVTDNFWLWLFHRRELTTPWHVLLAGPDHDQDAIGRLMRQSMEGEVYWGREFPVTSAMLGLEIGSDTDFENKVYTTMRLHGGLSSDQQWQSKKPGPVVTALSTRFQPPVYDAELVNAIAVRNEEDELIECLRLVEPRLTKLKYLKLPGHAYPYVYADIGFGRGKDLIPATQLGQGFARLLDLFATIMVNRTKILLIDEFENGLQHDALVPVWRSLGKMARARDIQIFATTHSYECIQAAHEAAASQDGDYDLGVIKLQWDRAKEVEAVMLDREMIETALDARLEVR